MKTFIIRGNFISDEEIKNSKSFNELHESLPCVYCSEKFKEKAGNKVKEDKRNADVITNLVSILKTEARWQKAVQHLREDGILQEAPQDIGNLIKEIIKDVIDEEEDYIKEFLYAHYIKQIKGRITTGFPEWYKHQLLNNLEFPKDDRGNRI